MYHVETRAKFFTSSGPAMCCCFKLGSKRCDCLSGTRANMESNLLLLRGRKRSLHTRYLIWYTYNISLGYDNTKKRIVTPATCAMVTVKSTHLSKGNSKLSNSVWSYLLPRHPCAKPTNHYNTLHLPAIFIY